MKHQYFGDVNDFRKYGLLRCLQRESELRLAVCWMLTPDDGRTDGQFISYLAKPGQWRGYDPELFDLLAEAVPSGRNLLHVGEKQLLPGSILIDGPVPDNRVRRANYFRIINSTAEQLARSHVFDPDNGIEVRSCPPGKRNSSKYVTWSELVATYKSGRSVLVYQHFPRQNRVVFTLEVVNQLITRTGARVVFDSLCNVALSFLLPPNMNNVSFGDRQRCDDLAGANKG